MEALNQVKIDTKNEKFEEFKNVKNLVLDFIKTVPIIGDAFDKFDKLLKTNLDIAKNILKSIGFVDNEISSIANEKEGSDVANSLTDYIAKKIFDKIHKKQNQNITNESIIKSVIGNFLEKYNKEMIKPEVLDKRLTNACLDALKINISTRVRGDKVGYNTSFNFNTKTKTKKKDNSNKDPINEKKLE